MLDLTEGKVLLKVTSKYLAVNVLLFVVPFIIGEPQILIGSVVNFLLVYIALNFKESKLIPAIFLPAISSLLRNIVFGSLTPYLAILMPFIWISNGLFIMSIRSIYFKTKRLSLSLFSSALIKALFLFLCTFALVLTLKFPNILLTTMSIMQFITASIGVVGFLIINKYTGKNS